MPEMKSTDRSALFMPPKRPEWVERINEEGRCMDIKSIVPLDENSLIAHAKANTGLADFGDENWHEPFQVLIKALNEESKLNLMGRLMTRSDLLIFLEARLRVEDAYKKHPEIENEEIHKPLYIIGQGRTGTSILFHMMAEDPDNRAMLNAEVMFPWPPPETETWHNDPRIEKATQLQHQYYRVTPEMRAIHDYGGNVPCENVHLHCLSFRSPAYINAHQGQVPSYLAYMRSQDLTLHYCYEKRVLKLLQWKRPAKRWLFKSPYAMVELRAILEVYPDSQFILTHRDPIKALSSIVNLLGTLNWNRSDHSFIGGSLAQFVDPKTTAAMLNRVVDLVEDGSLPKAQLCNLLFQDFIADPIGSVEIIYRQFGIEMTPQGRADMQKYMDDHPKSAKPEHKYSAGTDAQINEERRFFKRYQDYFSVPSEV